MATRPKSAAKKSSRGITKDAASGPSFFPHLADLIEDGEITVGTLEPVGVVATATGSDTCFAMLMRRKGETFMQLLQRLDSAVELAFTEDVLTDEINTPVKSSRTRK